MPTVNDDTLELVKKWEGLELKAYQDSAGVWTIGYGHTSGVRSTDTITAKQAEGFLASDLALAAASVDRLVTVPLSENQRGALTSFVFNLGAGALAGSTLLKLLNAGNYDAVPAELAKWVKATDAATGKKVTLPGLVNRRAAEAGLWAKGAFVASQDVQADPPVQPPSHTTVATAGGALGIVGGAAAMTPFAGVFERLADGAPYLVAGAVIAVVIVAAFLLLRRRQG